MAKIRLGRTDLWVEKNGFGALPIQRVPVAEAVKLLRRASDAGVDYFDTARGYTDSEEKLGLAFRDIRPRIVLATKCHAADGEELEKELDTCLRMLRTDYIDVFQVHNPGFVPLPGGKDGVYGALLKARDKGKIRFIGITNHKHTLAKEAAESGYYDVVQYPFSYLADKKDVDVVEACRRCDVGFVAMKGLSGGLIKNGKAAAAFMNLHENVVPVWGVQRAEELEEFIRYIGSPPELTPELQAVIDRDRKELVGEFCRGCGYCLPCPAQIDIPTAARMSLFLRRSRVETFVTPEMRKKMKRIENCVGCRHCAEHCPYGIDTPELLKRNYADYQTFI